MLVVRCIKGYNVLVLTGTDAFPLDTPVRPYSSCTSAGSTTDAQIVRPYTRYSSAGSTTDAQIVRPYSRYSSRCTTTDDIRLDTPERPYSRYSSRCSTTDAVTFDTTDAFPLDTPVRPLQRVTRFALISNGLLCCSYLGAVETLVDLSPMLSALGGKLYGLLNYLCTVD